MLSTGATFVSHIAAFVSYIVAFALNIAVFASNSTTFVSNIAAFVSDIATIVSHRGALHSCGAVFAYRFGRFASRGAACAVDLTPSASRSDP